MAEIEKEEEREVLESMTREEMISEMMFLLSEADIEVLWSLYLEILKERDKP